MPPQTQEQLQNVYKDAGMLPVPQSQASISSATLKPSSTPSFQQPVQAPVYPVAGLNAEATPPLALTATETQAQSLDARLMKLNESLVGQSQTRTEEEAKQGIPALTQTQNDLNNRLKGLQNEALAIPLQLQQSATGRGITAGGLQPHQTASLRNNAIQALSTSSLLEASRGNLTTALSLVDRAVAQKFDPIREQIAVSTANLDLILKAPQYSLEQKNRAQAQKDIQDAKARQIAVQENEASEIFSLAVHAAGKGADINLMHQIQDAPTKDAALNLMVQAGLLDPVQAQKALMEISPGATVFDPNTGKALSGGASSDPTVTYYAQLLAEGKINLSNVPQNIRNSVVRASQGNINHQLSDGALTDIRQADAALAGLANLKAKIGANWDKLGPITGLAAINPWSSSRKLLSDIDRIRQTVGKALEGGVLRKEDEEKYKKILATLTDEPETAIYKIDQLTISISSDINHYKALQSQSGRYVAPSPEKTDLRSKYNY